MERGSGRDGSVRRHADRRPSLRESGRRDDEGGRSAHRRTLSSCFGRRRARAGRLSARLERLSACRRTSSEARRASIVRPTAAEIETCEAPGAPTAATIEICGALGIRTEAVGRPSAALGSRCADSSVIRATGGMGSGSSIKESARPEAARAEVAGIREALGVALGSPRGTRTTQSARIRASLPPSTSNRQSPAVGAQASRAGGKSELHRVRCRVTPGGGTAEESATEKRPPSSSSPQPRDAAPPRKVRVKRRGKSPPRPR